MAESVGDIAVRLSADIAPFQRGLGQATRSMGRFESSSQRMGRTLATVGRAGAAAMASIAAAGAALTVQAARTAVEIENLSRISQTSTTEFQRQAAAAESVGISSEKLADIFRDVTDRVGDFLATGAGPMADFFENIAPQVGVTADQFARLSGPEALQLYVSSLEAANVTQAEMTFYLEAMASDASNLAPLLRDNGQAMRELGDQAERTGRVMSSETIASGRQLDTVLRDISGTLRNTLNTALLESSAELNWLSEVAEDDLIPALNAAVPAIASIVAQIGEMAGMIARVGTAIDNLVSRIPGGWDTLRDGLNPFSGIEDMGDMLTGALDRRGSRLDYDNEPTPNPHGPVFVPPTPSPHGPAYQAPVGSPFPLEEVVFPPESGGGGGGGGGGNDWRAQLEAMQDRFQTEQETIQENYDRQMQMLEEFRQNRAGTEEEYNELERRINADHAAQMRQQEQEALRARLSILSGGLGSLATILEASGQRNLGVVRGLRVAEAVIEGYSAAVAAWRQGMTQGGPGLAVAYTAASVARTGAMIAQMKSSGSGSVNVGGGSVPQASAATGGGQTSRNVTIQLAGGPMFSRSQIVDLINGINEAVDDGAVVRLA